MSSLIRSNSEKSPADKLAESLIRKFEEDMAELKSGVGKSINPRACFDLLSSLGELKHNSWTTASESQRKKTEVELQKMESQLTSLFNSKGSLQSCMELGYAGHLSRIGRDLAKVTVTYERNRVGTGYTSYEINDGLLGLRDTLGYADLLLSDLGIELSSKILTQAEETDQKLKSLLPPVIDAFRKSNDDPTPFSDAFPPTFWWRRFP